MGLPTSAWGDTALTVADALAQAPTPGDWRRQGTVEHVFTHFSLTLDVYELVAGDKAASFSWTQETAARASLPTLFRKALLDQAGPKSARTLARKVSMGARPASVLKCQ